MSRLQRSDHHGFPAIRLTAPDGGTAMVTAYGAQVLSWVPAQGTECLYLSDRARYARGAAIRGGIPVVFPQFGAAGPLPRHGFARNLDWVLVESREGPDFALATFALTASEATRATWPHDFRAELTVSIGGARLDVELAVENRSAASFDFTAALHTYLRVEEIEHAALHGLRGLRYRDQTAGGREQVQEAERLVVDREIDRIYPDAPRELLLSEPQQRLLITMDGFPDVVVWNPWERQSAALDDMTPRGFREMLCVEAAVVATPVRVAPGALWTGRQALVRL